MQPWVGHGHPARWLELLDRLDGLGIETLVPGHGPVSGAGVTGAMRDDVAALGEPPAAMPERFAAHEGAEMWERNVAALAERATKSAG